MTFSVVTNVYAGRVPEHQPIVPIKDKVVTLKLLNLVHIFPMDIQHSLQWSVLIKTNMVIMLNVVLIGKMIKIINSVSIGNVFDGFEWYCSVFHYLAWSCTVF